MPDVATTSGSSTETRALDAASVAKLRALARPGHSPRTFLRSITAVEIASVALLVVLVVGVILVYSFWILPDQVRFVQLSNEVQTNRKTIDDLQAKVVDPNSVTSQFQEVLDSLDAFRGSVLRPRAEGKQEILQAIDKTVRETGVSFAGSVTFHSADEVDVTKKENRQKQASLREVASYPSLAVQMSISGSYEQLRSFISRFEGTNQFVVIDSVDLSTEPKLVESETPGRGPVAPRARGAASGGLTLDIGMTAYFQPDTRPAAR